MSFVDQVKLILWKDVRRLKWALAALAGVVLLGVWVDVQDVWHYRTGEQYQFLALLLFYLCGALAIALSVHEERLVGAGSYWRTRPIRPMALLAAKILFALIFLALLPAVVDVGVLAWFGEPMAEWPSILLNGMLQKLLWFVPAAAIAALSSGIPVFLLGLIGAGLLYGVGVATFEWQLGQMGAAAFESAWQLPVIGVASAVVLWRQYRGKGRVGSVVWMAATILLGPFASLVPWHSATWFCPGDTVEAGATIPPRGMIELLGAVPEFGVEIELNATARGAFPIVERMDGTVRLENGRTASAYWRDQATFRQQPRELDGLANDALGDFEWFGSKPEEYGAKAIKGLRLEVPFAPSDLPRSVTGFDGRVCYAEYRWENIATLVLEEGSAERAGAEQYEIVKITRNASKLKIDMRRSHTLDSDFNTWFEPELLLVNHGRRQVVWRHGEPEIAFDSYSYPPRVTRAGRTWLWFQSTAHFQIDDGFAAERLEDLELQVWRPVLRGRLIGSVHASNSGTY